MCTCVYLLPFTVPNHISDEWADACCEQYEQHIFTGRCVTYMSSNQRPHWPWVSRCRKSRQRLCPIFFCIRCHGEHRTWSQLTPPCTPSDTEGQRRKREAGFSQAIKKNYYDYFIEHIFSIYSMQTLQQENPQNFNKAASNTFTVK